MIERYTSQVLGSMITVRRNCCSLYEVLVLVGLKSARLGNTGTGFTFIHYSRALVQSFACEFGLGNEVCCELLCLKLNTALDEYDSLSDLRDESEARFQSNGGVLLALEVIHINQFLRAQ